VSGDEYCVGIEQRHRVPWTEAQLSVEAFEKSWLYGRDNDAIKCAFCLFNSAADRYEPSIDRTTDEWFGDMASSGSRNRA
jgi:hypothetical protein